MAPGLPVAPELEAGGLGALDSGGPLTVTVTVTVTPLSRALQVCAAASASATE